jgi:hypothetical protein
MEEWWWVADNIIFRKAHRLANRDAIVEEIMMCELTAFINTRQSSISKTKMYRDSLWRASRPTSS